MKSGMTLDTLLHILKQRFLHFRVDFLMKYLIVRIITASSKNLRINQKLKEKKISIQKFRKI